MEILHGSITLFDYEEGKYRQGDSEMRLFYAVKPDQSSLHRIALLQKDLAEVSDGRWIPQENLHLTMLFLGSVDEKKIPELREVLSLISFQGTEAQADSIGAFAGRNGSTVFLGIQKNAELAVAQMELQNFLKEKGYVLEDREFLPHITLARHVHMHAEIRGKLKKSIRLELSGIHLYSSEEKEGRRVYTQL